jgi:pyruvate formate lyase activating enzyme
MVREKSTGMEIGNRKDIHRNISRRSFLKGSASVLAGTAIGLSIPTRLLSVNDPVEAKYYRTFRNNSIQCLLCPRACRMEDGERGDCEVRENRAGVLYTLVYGNPCALHLDPIEKKPFFHVLPGTQSLSLSTVGCNLKCKFCQNWQISQSRPEDVKVEYRSPEKLAEIANTYHAPSIAYTYGEPTVFYEYMCDTADAARKRGIKNLVVSAGFINKKPLIELCKRVDAIKIDLKSFTNSYYVDICDGWLEPVLNTLVTIKEAGSWLEIVYLMVPTLNDDPVEIKEMAKWIISNLGPDTPMHFSRFYPRYQLKNLPPTPLSSLESARKICLEEGLKFVYIGNVGDHEAENTYCPSCSEKIISRAGYRITSINLKDGKCPYCNTAIPGLW